jgi:hypothetical protein
LSLRVVAAVASHPTPIGPFLWSLARRVHSGGCVSVGGASEELAVQLCAEGRHLRRARGKGGCATARAQSGDEAIRSSQWMQCSCTPPAGSSGFTAVTMALGEVGLAGRIITERGGSASAKASTTHAALGPGPAPPGECNPGASASSGTRTATAARRLHGMHGPTDRIDYQTGREARTRHHAHSIEGGANPQSASSIRAGGAESRRRTGQPLLHCVRDFRHHVCVHGDGRGVAAAAAAAAAATEEPRSLRPLAQLGGSRRLG